MDAEVKPAEEAVIVSIDQSCSPTDWTSQKGWKKRLLHYFPRYKLQPESGNVCINQIHLQHNKHESLTIRNGCPD